MKKYAMHYTLKKGVESSFLKVPLRSFLMYTVKLFPSNLQHFPGSSFTTETL